MEYKYKRHIRAQNQNQMYLTIWFDMVLCIILEESETDSPPKKGRVTYNCVNRLFGNEL